MSLYIYNKGRSLAYVCGAWYFRLQLILQLIFLQIYKQNIDLKVEVSQLKLSENNLSDEFEKLKDKYHSLSQDFEKTTFIKEAEIVMDELEKTLIEIKSSIEKSSLDKVHTQLQIYNRNSDIIVVLFYYNCTVCT